MNRAVPMDRSCWEVEANEDERWPHCATEAEARELTGTFRHLLSPCWEARCRECGAEMEDEEGYTNTHYRSAADAEADDTKTCSAGCKPPSPDPVEVPPEGMDPLPGIDGSAMTLDDFRGHEGRRVIYTDPHGPTEFGVVTSVSSMCVFVRYGHAVNSQATPPERLTFETPS